ncbi:hypothetical protein FWK35_00003757, partial [Aphis craccivora]
IDIGKLSISLISFKNVDYKKKCIKKFIFIPKISKLNKIFFIRFLTYNGNLLQIRIIFYKHLMFYDRGYSPRKPVFFF